MSKNTKMLIVAIGTILIICIIFAISNKKDKNENNNSNANTNEIQMNVEPDREPNQDFIDNLKNPSFMEDHKNDILNVLE